MDGGSRAILCRYGVNVYYAGFVGCHCESLPTLAQSTRFNRISLDPL